VTLDRGPDDVRGLLHDLPGISAVSHVGDEGSRRDYALSTDDPEAVAPRVAAAVAERGWSLYALGRERHDLESLFGQIAEGLPGAQPADASDAARGAAHV
jgi:hypothetical protein